MKHLFVIRHGDHIRGALTEQARVQVRAVADQMKSICGEIQVGFYLLSSTAPRAEDTADIIAHAFGITEYTKDDRLRTRSGHLLSPQELQAIDGMIDPHAVSNDAIAITTHYEVAGQYPPYFLEKEFGRRELIQIPGRGEGIHFDLERRTYQMIPTQ